MLLVTYISLLFAATCSFANAAEANYTNQGLDKVPMGIPTSTTNLLLSKNNIAEVAAEDFSGFYQLKTLYLDFNKLQVFPNFSYISSSLEILFLNNNEIEVISESHLDNLVKLKKVLLSYNHLTNIPDVLGPSLTLANLDLTGNRLKDTPCLTKLGRNLVNVNFNENQIENIQATCFRALGPGTIKEITFRDNNIATIPERYDLVSGNRINLKNNPIICDSCIAWTLEGDVQINGKCDSPIPLFGRNIDDLTLEDLEEPPLGEGNNCDGVLTNSGK